VAISSLPGNFAYKDLICAIEPDFKDDCRNLTGPGRNARLDRFMFPDPKQRGLLTVVQNEGNGQTLFRWSTCLRKIRWV
jgi:hypothetical protein